MKSLKQKLFDECIAYTENRILTLTGLLKDLQQSANEETKSSAGDKYETGRSMAQLEIEKVQTQLAEVNKLKQELIRIPTEETTKQIKAGSLIFTSRGNFYISIHAGQLIIDDQFFFAVSSASPIAQKLIGLTAGQAFSLNDKDFTIHEIQ